MQSRRLILAALVLSAVFLFVAAIVLAASYVALSSRGTASASVTLPAWRDPTKVDALKIDVPASVAVLAGTPEPQAISAMLAAGALDAAYETTIFSTSLDERQRAGELLLVGERYAAAGNEAQARLTYQALLESVALSPSFSDYERAEMLAQASKTLYRFKDQGLAGLAIDAGRAVALESPFLKNAHRFMLLGQLLQAAQAGNDQKRVAALNDDRANYVDASDSPPAARADVPDPLPAIEQPARNDTVSAALSKRQAAAQKIARLAASGASVSDDQINELANALFAEDDARIRAFNAPSSQQSAAQKIALARAQVDWLTFKYRIARKGFGTSIMPEWEDAEGEIRAQLAKAYEKLYTLRDEQAVAVPQQRDVDLAQSYLLRRQLLAGRLGIYPDFPEGNLVDDLNDATERLMASQPKAALRVKVDEKNGQFYYHLVNDEAWNNDTPGAKPNGVPSRPTAVPSRATP